MNTPKSLRRLTGACLLGWQLATGTVALAANPADPYANETPAQHNARMAWWREARFGMFIHWGVYAVPAGRYQGQYYAHIGEWLMHDAKIPMATYQAYAQEFNPVQFDAAAWVKTARDAGMKYIVITAKHHDGFAMFPTAVNQWSLPQATPFHRDPLQELAQACRKYGVKLGFYYSQAQDWNNGGSTAGGNWDLAQKHSMDDYIDRVAVPQMKELLTRYGSFPAVLWWDTPIDMNEARAAKLAEVLKLKPASSTTTGWAAAFRVIPKRPSNTFPPPASPAAIGKRA